ncbi:dicarboxylate/amino acid:cation symporter [Methylocucumis oryzae]|uniref:C4-dicarboxylate ABC transporter n=1 Tax=Methylocucumis oryzae TaxID=1632867 RepID=A0A0F3IEH1_9GAMM|nr:dicarboxylate/amino acid:cation symporter [Methylocucumis oryzae]KJV05205.1 C4-dicarboxylate ABC transporter [Methylocucumis oryzae]
MTHPHAPAQPNRQTLYVLIALGLGIIVGELLHLSFGVTATGTLNPTLAVLIETLSVVTDCFMRLIKMIIAPLVFATLVVGIGKMGDAHTVGRVGLKALAWFLSASLMSLVLGMILVNVFTPGESLHIALPSDAHASQLPENGLSLRTFATHIFPTSIFSALSANEILQIVVFSVFFGVASAQLGELADPMLKALDSLAHIMLKVTTYVMYAAPIAVFAALTAVIAKQGLSLLATYGIFIAEFYLGLLTLWLCLISIGVLILGGKKILSLLRHIREPLLLAFGTASSEAAYPKLLQQLERLGCDAKIAGFVLPLGYSFNLDGSMMYMTFAVLFIAQAYGIEMSLGQQALMLLVLLFTSKGVAGVPRASLVVISATLSLFHIPEAGILLLLGVDQLLDMGRSASNVLGNSLATTVISRWEKALK